MTAPLDRLKAAFAELVERVMRASRYQGLHGASVVDQDGEGRLDLRPDDPAFGELREVPVRYGVPGVAARIPAGTRVTFGFEDADPRKPVVLGWDASAAPTECTLGGGGATVKLAGGHVTLLPEGVTGQVRLGVDGAGSPIAAGGDAVASAVVTAVPTRKVRL